MNNKTLFTSLVALLLFTGTDCKDKPPVVPPDNKPPDTTSHNFTWTTYTFGGTGGSSYFKDVAIVNDSDIWAVGAIYTSPETTYNAAHWDGKKWELKTLVYNAATLIPSIRGIYWIDGKNFYLAAGSIFAWDGKSNQTDMSFSRLNLPDANATIEKIWGNSTSNVFGVGNAGTIVHYNGTTWSKHESGTTIDLRDVWGTPDGKVVWACGYSNDNFRSILLKYDGISWKTIWQRDGTTAVAPYGYNVGSVWRASSTYVTSSNGVFRLAGDTVETKLSNSFSGFTPSIRGNSDNDIVVCGDDATIWHYNGANGKELVGGIPTQPLNASSVKENIITVVGSDYSIFPNSALIYVGKRN